MTRETGFITAGPSPQNVLDVFDGEWSAIMPPGIGATARPGLAALFSDARIEWASACLGPLEGLDVLELGPLEGAHSYMLEQAGAAFVTAVEGNPRAFLKCLCIKEIMDMKRVSFKLGNFVPYLAECRDFDAIFACGVLYHMADPLRLLEGIVAKTDRVMIWTHYYDADVIGGREDRGHFGRAAPLRGTRYRASRRAYPDAALAWRGFSGGSEKFAYWLERRSLLDFFADHGFDTSVNFDQADNANGPAMAICARRERRDAAR